MFSKIFVGVDGSPPRRRAFAVALDLAKHYRAPLHVCSVIEDVPKYDGESIADVDEAMERAPKRSTGPTRRSPRMPSERRSGWSVT
jgi:nucleotide-binding universal stress UspA family protein